MPDMMEGQRYLAFFRTSQGRPTLLQTFEVREDDSVLIGGAIVSAQELEALLR
jgi:hypothetical protein